LQIALALQDRNTFRLRYLTSALAQSLIEMRIAYRPKCPCNPIGLHQRVSCGASRQGGCRTLTGGDDGGMTPISVGVNHWMPSKASFASRALACAFVQRAATISDSGKGLTY